ncbi:GNAT family N-acetyltransferase [Thalassotalea agarivorans]|uniref:Acetyltransferase (GNAT) family protein n=1 Tax=Thalassotalea agarivorans TaxID=349064 RepID=A0A1I0HN39_THASX|nr:GNAT family N-acetyltransferase [Thalassotalea agarivorans]SET85470.1 Acetyltransferase (GNAT) family protein [Thalassotalea agarivorans]
MNVQLADETTSLVQIAQVLHELRPQFSAENIQSQIKEQMADGYQIAYVEEAGEVLSVAGFVFGKKLAWGKHIYVDDFVTTQDQQSMGAGKYLLDWLKQHARDHGCQQLHLDSGVQRYMAHKFYLREGFIIASHHFSVSPL